MKKLITFLFAIALTASIWAQAPQKMSYQAVIRNSSNALVTNAQVGIRISIIQGSATGTEVYKEIYNPIPSTNANGLVSIEIGAGIALTGTYANIDWSGGPYFIKTETDPSGGTNYTITGTSQLLSVPYALYAKTAENVTGLSTKVDKVIGKGLSTNDYTTAEQTKLAGIATGAQVNVKPDWNAASGNVAEILNKPSLFNGSYTNLTSKPANIDEDKTDDVALTGNQTIAGNKTFTGTTTVSTPVNATDAATKAYVIAIKESIYNELLDAGLKGAVKDIEGNTYKTIKIGTQIWLAENLATSKFANGDDIPLVSDSTYWINLTSPGYCWYNNNKSSYKNTNGALYNWYAANSNNLCPTGWHVPTQTEFTILIDYLTNNGYGYENSGNDIAKSLATISSWKTNDTEGTIGNDPINNNASGFSAYPSGARGVDGEFAANGSSTSFWCYTENGPNHIGYIMGYGLSIVVASGAVAQVGGSVRCLKD
jgi:uncharacterized protein (TIGR02145 family)